MLKWWVGKNEGRQVCNSGLGETLISLAREELKSEIIMSQGLLSQVKKFSDGWSVLVCSLALVRRPIFAPLDSCFSDIGDALTMQAWHKPSVAFLSVVVGLSSPNY